MEMISQSPRLSRLNDGPAVTYVQRDVDVIKQQIEQTESSKRRGLIWALVLTLVVLAGSIAWWSTNYARYATNEADKQKLAQENAALRLRAEQTQQQLDAANAALAQHAQQQADVRAKLQRLLPDVLKGSAGPGEMATFAQMVHNEASGRLELDQKPPDKLFRNWKVSGGDAPGTYALVGGFVDGKWVVYSNLVARRSTG